MNDKQALRYIVKGIMKLRQAEKNKVIEANTVSKLTDAEKYSTPDDGYYIYEDGSGNYY